MAGKPKFLRKHDRLLHGAASKEEVAADHAMAPFDRVAKEMDRTWGWDLLPTLVSPETAEKYGKTHGSLNEALKVNDSAWVADRAAACIRGMHFMDAEARAAGHVPPVPVVTELRDFNGQLVCGVIEDVRLSQIAEAAHPGLRIYSWAEIATILGGLEANPLLSAVKDAFPGAVVTAIRPKRGPVPDEVIPF